MSDNEPRREIRRRHMVVKPFDLNGEMLTPGTEMILNRAEFDSLAALGALHGSFEDGRPDHPDDDDAA